MFCKDSFDFKSIRFRLVADYKPAHNGAIYCSETSGIALSTDFNKEKAAKRKKKKDLGFKLFTG